MQVAIIGAGAAGLMTAASIKELDPTIGVLLLERNDSLGAKVMISGGGRCNVTTGIEDVRAVLKNYPRGGKFLTSAMYAFPPSAVRGWFETHGVPLYCQDDMRVFPKSDDGKDVVAVFERIFRETGVEVRRNASVTDIAKMEAGKFAISVKGAPDPIIADAVVLTTGGQAYRHTGSTGDGYAFAQALGHTLTPLGPGLTALTTAEKWPASVSGIALPSARISSDKDKAYDFTGPLLFTHKGLSGPATFAFSSLIAFETLSRERPLPIRINAFPTETADSLAARITDAIAAHPAKSFQNIVATLVPHALVDVVVKETGMDALMRGDQTPKRVIRSAADWLTRIPLTIDGRVAGNEFITAGGVPTDEIDPRTMQSLRCPGLYFAGEIMDVDGFTGGFNLQASWAAGRLAGKSIASP